MKSINLKAHILLPLTLVLVLVLAAFLFGVYHEEQEYLADDLARSIQAVEGHYRLALEERAHKLGAALEVIAADTLLRSALAAHDREALLGRALPLFQRLKAEYNVTHFYFHDQHRINILRVHQPNRFNDTIDRFTALGAEKTKALSHGMELGPLGTFTLRAVLPLWEENRLIGYIELGEEVGQIIQDIKDEFDIDFVVYIDKQYLHQADWASGMIMLERKAEWERFTDMVVVSQTLHKLPQGLKMILSRTVESLPTGDIEVIQDDQRYRGRILTLRDVGGRPIGGIVVLRNMTAHIQSTWNTVIIIGGGGLVLSIFLFLLFYVILGRVEHQLKTSLKGLRESQLHLVNAQRMSHLGNWDWDLAHNTLHCSDEAARILGLEESDSPFRYEDLVNLIHPAERDEFKRLMDKARNNGDIHRLVHRIIRQDGSERYVRHRAEAVRNPSGDLISINATIHDITELQQAETLSTRMEHILEHSWNEIYIFDADQLHFIVISDGARKNHDYSQEEMMRMTPIDLKPEFTHDQFEALVAPLRRGVKQQITFETVHQRKDGSRYPVEVRLQLSQAEQPPVFIAIAQDISERKRYIQELEHKALYDALTALPNRFLLLDRLKRALKIAKRETSPLAVLMINVQRLREINDVLGYQNGDLILMEMASRLQKELSESDTVARLGGGEFAIVLPSVDLKRVLLTVEKIQKLFEESIIIEDAPIELEAAIGIAQYPEHGDTATILIQRADISMRVAKNEASGFSIYNPSNDPFSVRQLRLYGELRQAIKDRTLAVFYQPKVDIKTGRVTGVEALARWPHPTDGMISPGDFIPMIEQSGLIRPFTLWVLEQAIKQSKRWTEAGTDLTVAVNLSTRNLLDPSLADSIAQLFDAYQVSPDRLTLEITESAVMSRPKQALKILMHLHAMGIKLSIDDFGTGYSSLAYLKQLPVTELKIDYSFVSGINDNETDAVIVRSTIDLAHNLGLSVVAEGVENKDVLDMLAILRCDTAQGYYFSRPIPAEELEQWLTTSSWGQQDEVNFEVAGVTQG